MRHESYSGHLDFVLTLQSEDVKGHISCPAQSPSHHRGQAERNIYAVRTSDRVCRPPRLDGAAPGDKGEFSKLVYMFDSRSNKKKSLYVFL